ncbi:hypothetical protein DFJ77DRAFT_4336 [Powellomyces hirtus]|nr:hypothetical protein DFJ77DRAFT_4336 [Powellomyces hirtus]
MSSVYKSSKLQLSQPEQQARNAPPLQTASHRHTTVIPDNSTNSNIISLLTPPPPTPIQEFDFSKFEKELDEANLIFADVDRDFTGFQDDLAGLLDGSNDVDPADLGHLNAEYVRELDLSQIMASLYPQYKPPAMEVPEPDLTQILQRLYPQYTASLRAQPTLKQHATFMPSAIASVSQMQRSFEQHAGLGSSHGVEETPLMHNAWSGEHAPVDDTAIILDGVPIKAEIIDLTNEDSELALPCSPSSGASPSVAPSMGDASAHRSRSRQPTVTPELLFSEPFSAEASPFSATNGSSNDHARRSRSLSVGRSTVRLNNLTLDDFAADINLYMDWISLSENDQSIESPTAHLARSFSVSVGDPIDSEPSDSTRAISVAPSTSSRAHRRSRSLSVTRTPLELLEDINDSSDLDYELEMLTSSSESRYTSEQPSESPLSDFSGNANLLDPLLNPFTIWLSDETPLPPHISDTDVPENESSAYPLALWDTAIGSRIRNAKSNAPPTPTSPTRVSLNSTRRKVQSGARSEDAPKHILKPKPRSRKPPKAAMPAAGSPPLEIAKELCGSSPETPRQGYQTERNVRMQAARRRKDLMLVQQSGTQPSSRQPKSLLLPTSSSASLQHPAPTAQPNTGPSSRPILTPRPARSRAPRRKGTSRNAQADAGVAVVQAVLQGTPDAALKTLDDAIGRLAFQLHAMGLGDRARAFLKNEKERQRLARERRDLQCHDVDDGDDNNNDDDDEDGEEVEKTVRRPAKKALRVFSGVAEFDPLEGYEFDFGDFMQGVEGIMV